MKRNVDRQLEHLMSLPWTIVRETTPEGDHVLKIAELPSVVVSGDTDEEFDSAQDGGCGGCCQWVLAAACEAVEWPSQPLGFESLALRTVTRYYRRVLTSFIVGLELRMQAAVSTYISSPE